MQSYNKARQSDNQPRHAFCTKSRASFACRCWRRYELSMKYILFIFFFISHISAACVVGPQSVQPTRKLGFEFKEEQSDLCSNCSMISIESPMAYDGRPASHAIFSVFQNGELISKTVTAFKKEAKNAEFVGIVSKEKGFNYEVGIEYGTGRCMDYKFVFDDIENGS